MLQISNQRNHYVRYFNKLVIATVAFVIFISSVFIVFERKNELAAADCGDVFYAVPTWLTDKINQNKPVYTQVAREVGVPWEMLAALHFRERNNSLINPSNGQGLYQMYSIYESDANFRSLAAYRGEGTNVSHANFLEQTRYAARFLQSKAKTVPSTPTINPRNLSTNETNLSLIKSTLFSYNGRASAYAQQAGEYGFSTTLQAYEGSPYVMSKFDCKRKSMGLITSDGSNSLTNPDTRMGAFTLYARLKGDSYWLSLQSSKLPACTNPSDPTTTVCVWRLYNQATKQYVFTPSTTERNSYFAQGYSFESVGFFGRIKTKPMNGQLPVYGLIKPSGGSFMTTNKTEYSNLLAAGWTNKGILFYADRIGANSGYPVYRLYNSQTGTHFWTENIAERNKYKQNGYNEEGVAFHQVSLIKNVAPPPAGKKLVYRFYGRPGNTHFWTVNILERDNLIRQGNRYEGIAFLAPEASNSSPVYRLYNTVTKRHFYTLSTAERDRFSQVGTWRAEGVAFYGNVSSSNTPVYRAYSPTRQGYFFSASEREITRALNTKEWRDEGVGWKHAN